jgi:hypothetical protein
VEAKVGETATQNSNSIFLSSFALIDLQMVEMSLRVLFRPDPHQLPFIYRRLGYGMPRPTLHLHLTCPSCFRF